MWHALALFVVVIVDAWTPTGVRSSYTLIEAGTGWPLLAAGWSSSPGSCCSFRRPVRAGPYGTSNVGGGHPVRGSMPAVGLGVVAVRDRGEVARLLPRLFLLLLRRGDDLVGEVRRHLLVVGEV